MADENVKLEDQMTDDERKALQESEDFITNFKEEDFQDPDKTEELRKRLADAKTTVHQKRHYRDKVTELSGKLDQATKDKKPEEKKPENKDDKKDQPAAPAAVDPLVAITFRQDHPELSKAVAQEILDHARAYNITPEDALKKPIVKQFIKDNNTKEDVDDATIVPGNRSGTGDQKKDWSNASEREIQAERQRIMQGQ